MTLLTFYTVGRLVCGAVILGLLTPNLLSLHLRLRRMRARRLARTQQHVARVVSFRHR